MADISIQHINDKVIRFENVQQTTVEDGLLIVQTRDGKRRFFPIRNLLSWMEH